MTIIYSMCKTDFPCWNHPLTTHNNPLKTLISFHFVNIFFSIEFPFNTLDIKRILVLKRKQSRLVKQNKTLTYCCFIINSILDSEIPLNISLATLTTMLLFFSFTGVLCAIKPICRNTACSSILTIDIQVFDNIFILIELSSLLYLL